jgi:putative glutamine transport system substrate-binding protein
MKSIGRLKVTIVVAAALAGVLLLSSLALATGTPALDRIRQRGVLKAGVKPDVLGFGFKNLQTGEYEGYEIELAKLLAKEILGDPKKIEFTPVTPKTRAALLDNGELDMIIATFTITPERRRVVDFSPVYYTDGIKLLVKKEAGIKSLTDLAGKTIGVAKGADTAKRLAEQAEKLGVKGVRFAEFETYPEILSALQVGRVQAFSTDGSILKYYESLDKSLILLPQRYSAEEYGIATKKGNDDLRDFVAEFITGLDKKGALDRLQAQFGIGAKSN